MMYDEEYLKFEEMFPNLKDKYERYEVPLFPDDTIRDDGLVTINNIQEYCIDKQRVKEATNKILEYANMKYANGDFMIEHTIRMELIYKICELKKELGLED